MKKVSMKGNPSSNHCPAGSPQGARRATGGDPAGGTRDGSGSMPADPEVFVQKRRRKLTAHYKLRILQEADKCLDSGQIGALLRREGLYSTSLTRWRRQREQGLLKIMAPKTRGRKPIQKAPMLDEVSRLQKENQLLRKKLWQAERIIEVQKKISEILGINQDLSDLEDSK
jgi:transposase